MSEEAREKAETKEVDAGLPVLGSSPEVCFYSRKDGLHLRCPLVTLSLVARTIEVRQAGNALGHQQVQDHRIDQCQFLVGARDEAEIFVHGPPGNWNPASSRTRKQPF